MRTMQTRPFGHSKREVPAIGLGTWNLERDDRQAAIAALRRGLDLGMTHVDTAELYGTGEVEELVAEAIEGRRDEIFLVSKALPYNASARGTIAACERSLARLRTDHLDCYLLHWPGDHPFEDTIGSFERLVRDGKIRSWGLSNCDVAELRAAEEIAGPGRITCNQVLYHLEQRGIEHAVLPWCEHHGVAVVAYSPFGSGSFPSPRSAGGRRLPERAAPHHVTPHAVPLAGAARRPSTFVIPQKA